MTIGIAVKVFDGLVLASDSATTLDIPGAGSQVYNNANKVFHLHRHLPIAAMTWGLGNIGDASIGTLAKDLRERLMGLDAEHGDWKLGDDYTIESVAMRLVEMIFPLYCAIHEEEEEPPFLGFLVAGFGGEEKSPEAWQVEFSATDPEAPPQPTLALERDVSGWSAYAQPEAVVRLFNGVDVQTLATVIQLVPEDKREECLAALTSPPVRQQPVMPSMPIADAIALAKFMVETTIGYRHFLFGPDTVGGPVEVACLTRHEGFKWIQRKYYYDRQLNPRES